MNAAELILSRYDLRHYLPEYKPNAADRLFSVFFLLCLSFFLFVLVHAGFLDFWKSMPLPLLILIVGTLLTLRSRPAKPVRQDND